MNHGGPDHCAFLRELEAGRTVELWVALKFLEAGCTVRVGALDRAETPWEADRFREEQDVVVDGRHIIEVKSSSYPFTSRDDFPFPGAYTCTVKRWEERQQKPLAFVLVSQPTRAMLVVSGRTQPEWEVITSHDARRAWKTPTYRAPLSVIRPFDDLLDALVGQKGEARAA